LIIVIEAIGPEHENICEVTGRYLYSNV